MNRKGSAQLIEQVIHAQGEVRLHRQLMSQAVSTVLRRYCEQGYDFDRPAGRYSLRLIAMPRRRD